MRHTCPICGATRTNETKLLAHFDLYHPVELGIERLIDELDDAIAANEEAMRLVNT